MAAVTGFARLELFQGGDLFLQDFELGASTLQHRGLGLEFFPGHQVEPAQGGLQTGSQVAPEIGLEDLQSYRQVTHQAVTEVIKKFGVDHG